MKLEEQARQLGEEIIKKRKELEVMWNKLQELRAEISAKSGGTK